MTKKEFAIRLLFWLTPWPISKALPRALRIYYYGPGAAPPLFPLPPGEAGPYNPFDPYIPGPGGSYPSHPNYQIGPLTEVTIECEDTALMNTWLKARGNDGDSWTQARNSPLSITTVTLASYYDEMVGFEYNDYYDRWYLARTWLLFDLTALPSSKIVDSVSLLLYGKRYDDLKVSVQKSTQADPYTAPEWDDFTGDMFSNIDWVIDADNTFTFNSAGISYIQSVLGSFAKLVVRDYDYDYKIIAPAQGEKWSGARSTQAASSQVPRLVINYW